LADLAAHLEIDSTRPGSRSSRGLARYIAGGAMMTRRDFLASLPAASAAVLPAIASATAGAARAAAQDRPPIKLGLISAASYGAAGAARASGSHHGTAFATTFNGWDEAK